MEYIEYVYYGVPLLIVIVLALYMRPKKTTKVVVDDELIMSIFESIKKENIIKVESEVSRVKIDVEDLDLVDFDKLKAISEGVFISGKSLKIMFKDSADKIVDNLRRGL